LCGENGGDLDGVINRQSSFDIVCGIHSNDHRKTHTSFPSYRVEYLKPEAEPIVEEASVFILALVCVGRKELVYEIAMTKGQFQRIETGLSKSGMRQH
jgi:hypothetical protein